jgi:phage-related protein
MPIPTSWIGNLVLSAPTGVDEQIGRYIINANGQASCVEAIVLGRQDLLARPEEIQDINYALFLAQTGKKGEQAKPLKIFGSAGGLEVVEDWRGDTFRAIWTVRYASAAFLLHVFHKKSKRGRATRMWT